MLKKCEFFAEQKTGPRYLLISLKVPDSYRAIIRTGHVLVFIQKAKTPDLIGDVVGRIVATHVLGEHSEFGLGGSVRNLLIAFELINLTSERSHQNSLVPDVQSSDLLANRAF
jgi:hypothetical protein